MNLFSDYNSLSEKEKKLYAQAVKFLYITIAIAILLFYVMPFGLGFGGKFGYAVLELSYISVYPVFVFGAGFFYCKKFGFHIIVPVGLAIFYLPTTFIFFGDYRGLPFVFAFIVFGLFGELTAYLFNRRKNSKRQPFGLNRLVKNAEAMEKKSSKTNKNKK
ncbi:MAG: hypothetical protein IJA34_02175 [Lachnospiraceae bacterium]|nr:hypothetical protein [Lachnospiraceae bacterium]